MGKLPYPGQPHWRKPYYYLVVGNKKWRKNIEEIPEKCLKKRRQIPLQKAGK
jgi:hypothetical protein